MSDSMNACSPGQPCDSNPAGLPASGDALAGALPAGAVPPVAQPVEQIEKGKATFDDIRPGKGTKEWSDVSYNICLGCEHGCLYCYAKSQACWTKPEMRIPGNWNKQKLNPKKKRLGAEVGAKGEVGKRGVVMFPTSHDITPRFLKRSLKTIKNLLKHNLVLIVSKPHLSVVQALCKELANRKKEVRFCFTIGSLNKSTCAFWEPGAPPPRERIAALKHAFDQGFQTSVSMEPMLEDREGISNLVAEVEPYVTHSIWIGKMQRIPTKYNAHVQGFKEAESKIRAQQTDENILELFEVFNNHSKVRWKDSIHKVLETKGKTPSYEVEQNNCAAAGSNYILRPTVYSKNRTYENNMTETTIPNPVEQVRNAVKTLQDQKAALEKQLADIDAQLQEIADTIGGAKSKGKPGRKPGSKPRGRAATPVSEEDTKKLLEAMNKIGGKMRSSDAYKKAGLSKNQGKKAMKALRAEKKVKVSGPWVSVA